MKAKIVAAGGKDAFRRVESQSTNSVENIQRTQELTGTVTPTQDRAQISKPDKGPAKGDIGGIIQGLHDSLERGGRMPKPGNKPKPGQKRQPKPRFEGLKSNKPSKSENASSKAKK